jgi:hypothetical protein
LEPQTKPVSRFEGLAGRRRRSSFLLLTLAQSMRDSDQREPGVFGLLLDGLDHP